MAAAEAGLTLVHKKKATEPSISPTLKRRISRPMLCGSRFYCSATAVITIITATVGVALTDVTAAPILIDDFTVNQGTFFGSQNLANTNGQLYSNTLSGSFGPFATRKLESPYAIIGANNVTFSGSAAATGNGSLTMRHAKGGPPLLTSTNSFSRSVLMYDQNGGDLTAGGGNNALQFVFSSVTVTGLSPVVEVWVNDLSSTYSGPLFPTTTVGGTTVVVPFSSFSDPSVFSSVSRLRFLFSNEGASNSGAARSAEYVLTNVSVVSAVPEPATYAMALAGVACGGFSMWRRRKQD